LNVDGIICGIEFTKKSQHDNSISVYVYVIINEKV